MTLNVTLPGYLESPSLSGSPLIRLFFPVGLVPEGQSNVIACDEPMGTRKTLENEDFLLIFDFFTQVLTNTFLLLLL